MTAQSLAICLDAPMQSWGVRGRGIVRDTATQPTKSGIVGLVCCALGTSRDDHAGIARIADLRMGVRVDREGIIERDYHTTQNVPTTTGTGHRTVESHRYYLADALFLVVLNGDTHVLHDIYQALLQPRWQIYLGRRAYVPTRPLVADNRPARPQDPRPTRPPNTGAGLVETDLDTVLRHHHWLEERTTIRRTERAKPERATLRTIVDCDPTTTDAEICHDHPLSFSPEHHTFRTRTIRREHLPLTNDMIDKEVSSCT